VLPALLPQLAYDDLEIQDGTIASVQYGRMTSDEIDPEEETRLRMALLIISTASGTPSRC
jgi:hypothetical protein